MNTPRRPVLLVEDNADDIELARIAFADAGIANPLHVVRDGVEALDYLFARGAYAEHPRDALPALVLLDLNLPKLDGSDVIRAIRADPATRALPVIALTSSAEMPGIDTDTLGVDSYLQKPVDFARFVQAVRQLEQQWLR